MAKFTSPLNNLKVASPCSQDWEAMIGNERKRFCGDCKLNVYNLSGMTRAEAENLLINSEGRLCVRFYKRADGTVLTQDCPVVSLFFGLLSGLGLMSLASQPKEERLMGTVAYKPTPIPKQTPDNAKMGEIVMGNFAVPTPTPKATPNNRQATVGMLSNDFRRERSSERQ